MAEKLCRLAYIAQCTNQKARTRIRQTATPFLERTQNKDFRGLGQRHITDSGGRLGSAGIVESCLAADVGKYIAALVVAR